MGIARLLTFDTPVRRAPARPATGEPVTIATPATPAPTAVQEARPCETAPARDKIVQLPPVGHLGGHLIFD